jgi:hypothetical protein
MEPVNSKSLLAFVFGQMGKLDRNEIDVAQASAQAGLAKQATSLLKYELDRVNVQMELSRHNAAYKDGTRLREIESKNFD